MSVPKLAVLTLAAAFVLSGVVPSGVVPSGDWDSLQAAPSGGGTAGTVELTHKNHRCVKLHVPDELYRPVPAELSLGGQRFTTALEGTALRIDTDGDGTLDLKVDGESGFVKLKGRGKDGEPVSYSLRLENRSGWRFTWGSTRVTKIGRIKVELIDRNLNGSFGDFGEDAIAIGRSRHASYLSPVIRVQDELYKIEVSPDGTELKYVLFDGPTGTFELDCQTDAKVISALVRKRDGSLCFDVASTRPIQIPVGEYLLESGHIGLGENRVQFRTGQSRTFSIRADESTTLKWGGPVRAEFSYTRDQEKLQLSPDNVRYYGAAGEEYHSWFPRGSSPTFTVNSKKSGREIAQAYFPGTC